MKVYVRPLGNILSPQSVEGHSVRLGGGLASAYPVEFLVRDGGRTVSRRLALAGEAGDTISQLPEKLQETAKAQLAHLSKAHGPLKLGERAVRLEQPQVMGILNVTPDSFSDGGRFVDDPQGAADAGFAMVEAGAAILDIGGESTRPDAPSVWEGDEIKRVEPVIAKLAASGAAISIDTRKAAVMEAALAAGSHMVNDVSALLYDDRSLDVVVRAECPVVLMHAPSSGEDPHVGGDYTHPVYDVFDWLAERIKAVVAAGIKPENILVDPGIGFGKSLADNLALINNLALFHALGQPLVFGASRKRLIGALSKEQPAAKRLGGSVALAVRAMDAGAQFIRAHDVSDTVQAAHVWRGLRDATLTDFTGLSD